MYGRGNLHPELIGTGILGTWALDQISGQCSEAWLEGRFLSIATNWQLERSVERSMFSLNYRVRLGDVRTEGKLSGTTDPKHLPYLPVLLRIPKLFTYLLIMHLPFSYYHLKKCYICQGYLSMKLSVCVSDLQHRHCFCFFPILPNPGLGEW